MQPIDAALAGFLQSHGSRVPPLGCDFEATELRDLVDSLGMIALLAFLEKTYEIEIADDEVTPETFQTVGSVIGFVRSKLPV